MSSSRIFNRGDRVLVQQTKKEQDRFNARVMDYNPRTREYLLALEDYPGKFVTVYEGTVYELRNNIK